MKKRGQKGQLKGWVIYNIKQRDILDISEEQQHPLQTRRKARKRPPKYLSNILLHNTWLHLSGLFFYMSKMYRITEFFTG